MNQSTTIQPRPLNLYLCTFSVQYFTKWFKRVSANIQLNCASDENPALPILLVE